MADLTFKPTPASDIHLSQNQAEKNLWAILSTDKLGAKFEKQRAIAGHIADFVCPDRQILVEIEGRDQSQMMHQHSRIRDFEKKGYKIIRFFDDEVLSDIAPVLAKIKNFIEQNPPKVFAAPNPWRAEFPVINAGAVAYLDTGASAQKPIAVIDALAGALDTNYANIHRGLYKYSQEKTEDFESARRKIASFIGAPSADNIIFTRNTTESINLVAQSWGRAHLQTEDEIILTAMEHHANIVPWQLIAEQTGAVIRVVPMRGDYTLDLDAFRTLLNPRTRMLAIVHVSNALGTINPVADMINQARAAVPDIKILIDGSQAVVHSRVNVGALDCDFYAFTGHKLYGPTGIGILYGKSDILNAMPPYQGGGDMIDRVSFAGTTYKQAPHRFEAGTPAIAEAIALGAAVDYVTAIGMDAITAHEKKLLLKATDALNAIGGIKIHGPAVDQKAAIISFTADWGHPSDIAMVLDQTGVAVRTGHHCCMPLMESLGIDGTVRVSFGLYNDDTDIDRLVTGLKKAKSMMGD